MPVPSPRNKILPVRGNIATLQSNVASLLEGEISYALDENKLYVKESGALVEAGGPAGKVLQVVNVQDGTSASGTTLIPIDNTTPQNTEGTEFMSLAITPTSATNKLLITVNAFLAASVGSAWTNMALFQDSTVDAIASWAEYPTGAGAIGAASFNHYMTAGTTSATTFKFRAGLNTAGTTYFNSNSGGAYFNGTSASSITIMEIAA